MSSTCISSNSHHENHKNQNKWVESDARFLRTRKFGGGGGVEVVDSRSCRQLYLRSAYTFSRNKDDDNHSSSNNVKEKAKKCLFRVRDRVAVVYSKGGKTYYNKVMRNDSWRKTKLKQKHRYHFSGNSLLSMVRRVLSCTVKVDAADQ